MNYRRFAFILAAFTIFHGVGILTTLVDLPLLNERMPWPDKTYSLLAAFVYVWCWEGRKR